MKFSSNMDNINRSGTFRFFALAKEAMAKSGDIIPLIAGELSEPTPAFIADAAQKAINDNFTKYTVNQGILELRQAICRKLENDNKCHFTPDQILVSNGVKQALFNILFALCGKKDEVIILAPYYPSYPEMIKICGAKPVVVETSLTNFLPGPETIKSAVTDNTKAIILNSPNNPTGKVYDKKTLAEIITLAKQNNLWIISDEIYEKIVYPPHQFYSIGEIADGYNKIVIVNGFSKSYSMTGWRIGYCAGPKVLIDQAEIIQSHTTSNANSISQMAALAALARGDQFIKSIIPTLQEKQKAIIEILNPIIKFSPCEGAFYHFFDISKFMNNEYNSSEKLAIYLLREHKVAVVPGSAFGAENYLRLSFSPALEKIKTGAERLKSGLEQLP